MTARLIVVMLNGATGADMILNKLPVLTLSSVSYVTFLAAYHTF